MVPIVLQVLWMLKIQQDLHLGVGRDDEETSQTFFNLGPRQFSGNAQANAKEVRNTFADYFVNERQVHWQWEKY